MIDSTGALLSWLVGRPDEAVANSARAMSAAEAYGDPFWIAHTLCALTLVHVWRRAMAAEKGRVVVATDTEAIAAVVRNVGGEAA